jgi:nucleoside-diphosphate-sugar epimerase
MAMKIFITGGTGFIGSHLLRRLDEKNYDVTALKRGQSLSVEQEKYRINWLERGLDEVEASDLLGFDTLIHMAAVGVSPRNASWSELVYWNISALMRLLDVSHKAGVKRIILTGTYAEYGKAADDFDFLDVDSPLLPSSPYAASKAAAYFLAQNFAVEKKIELVYLRLFSIYGEGQYEQNFWPSLKAAALNGQDFPMTKGEQIRDFMLVDDTIEAIIMAIQSKIIAPGQPFVVNVGTGNPISVRKFAEQWWTKWGAKGRLLIGAIPYREYEQMRFVPSPESLHYSLVGGRL